MIQVERMDAIDWSTVATDLDAQGWAILPSLIDKEKASGIARMYGDDAGFRSRVIMARHGFGQGEYRYFSYPLPLLVPRHSGFDGLVVSG